MRMRRDDFRTKVGNNLVTEDVEAAKQLLADAGYPNGEGLPTLQLIITNTKENKDKAANPSGSVEGKSGSECRDCDI